MSLQYFDLNSVTIENRFAPWTHGHDIDAITGLRAELDAAQSGLTSTSDILFHDAIIYGNMVPNTSGGQSLGSTTKHFGTAWIDELHLAQNTLYLGDTPVIGTNQDTVEIKADTDQNITLKTLGTGESKITSQNGVEISNSGLNGQIAIQSTGSGGTVSFGATSSINFTAPDANFSGDIEVTGHTVFNTATFTNDVVFQGDNIQMDTTNFTAEDNRITLNSGEQGSGVTAGFAGFDIDRGTLASWQFVFNEATDTFEYGPVGGTANVVVSKAYVDGVDALKLNVALYTAADVFSKVKSLDGSGSGLDADLLDGHEATYFVKSASDYMDAIQSIDGSGSGLDADLLDGEEGAYYAPQGSTYTKTEVDNIAAIKLDSSLYTNASVLSKLSNVDGAGSGLDADLLDGHEGTYFATASHTHSSVYLGLTAKAADADKLDGHDSTYFASQDSTYTNTEVDTIADTKLDSSAYTAADVLAKIKTVDGSGSGLDADTLDGHNTSYFSASTHNHNANYLGITAKAADADKLDGHDSLYFAVAGSTDTSSEVDAKIAALVDSSPAALDTLNELAAALGDDPNFATTVNNNIAAKLDSSAYTAADVLAKIKTVDGSGSGLNADQLDGHSASYFLAASAYTAADVLAKIKTVDGSGSGLDADMLDGHSASYFLSTTAKAADSNLLDGVDGTYYRGRNNGTTSLDPNLASYPNILSNHANTPASASYWHITTTFYSTISSTANRGQIAVQYNGGANFAVYARSCYSTTWTPWTRCDNNGTAADSTLFGGHPVSYFSVSTHNHSTTYLGITAKAADSDKLDGLNSTQFLRSDANDDMSGKLTIIKNVGTAPTYSSGQLELRNTDEGDVSMGFHRSGFTACQLRHESNGLILSGTTPTTAANLNVLGSISQNGAQVWHTGNDGSGSGLDADLLDGHQASYFSASTHAHAALYLGLHAKADDSNLLDGINSTGFATVQGRTVSDCNAAQFRISGMYGFNNTPTNGPGESYGAMIVSANSDTGLQIAGGYNNDDLYFRGWGGSGSTYYSWRRLIHSGNYTSFCATASHNHNATYLGITAKAADANLLDGHDSTYFLAATAKAADSQKVDGINGASLLRSDATDYQTNTIYTRGYLVAETDYRNRGIYGTYDSGKTQHIWSMGVAYKNAADGSDFGNLYGLAYKYNGSAGGHGVYLVNNGSALCGMGSNLWTSGIVLGQATSARYADLAEKYTVEGGLTEPGQVILLGSKKADARISDAMASQQVLGVVSTNPGLMMNSELDDGHYVALKGRVPCFVFGPCAAGDPLVSYKNGMAISINHPMVASLGDLGKTPGIILGKAIESTEEKGQSTIEIVVL